MVIQMETGGHTIIWHGYHSIAMYLSSLYAHTNYSGTIKYSSVGPKVVMIVVFSFVQYTWCTDSQRVVISIPLGNQSDGKRSRWKKLMSGVDSIERTMLTCSTITPSSQTKDNERVCNHAMYICKIKK